MEGALPQTPRVNAALLPDNVGRTVRLVGKFVALRGDSLVFETSDRQEVKVHGLDVSNVSAPFAEVLGTVRPDYSLSGYRLTPFGNSFGACNCEAS